MTSDQGLAGWLKGYNEARLRLGYPAITAPPGAGWDWYARVIAEHGVTGYDRTGDEIPALTVTAAEAAALYRKKVREYQQEADVGTGTLTAGAIRREITEPWAWTDEFWAVLGEPLGLPGDELDQMAPYDGAPSGTCRSCHLGPVNESTRLCAYCSLLARLKAEADAAIPSRHSRLSRPSLGRSCMVIACLLYFASLFLAAGVFR